jgi:uncharacterized membrane protein YoaK (UPF0700 family)
VFVTVRTADYTAAVTFADISGIFGSALRGNCDLAAHALTAPTAAMIALMALTALGLSGEPVHVRGPEASSSFYRT